MSRPDLLLLVTCLFLVYAGVKCSHSAMTPEGKHTMREKVLEMFHHAYNSYMDHAYPADELMPLSCKGRVRGVDPSRGDVDDALGKFSLTLIDTLDTLAVLGEIEEFEKAVRLVIKDVSFDNDVVVSVFETNIRVLGGLLGGHFAALALKNTGKGMSWYNNELVAMAKEIGYRLLPAFNTTTGIPYPRVNLKYGIHHPSSNTGSESDTCTACAGTMIMEFGALSRVTGDPIFEEKAQKAMESIWIYRSRYSDLVGTVINIHNGDWVRRDSSVGAGIDSYYEYCLKAYILFGDETYLERFNRHYKSIMQYMNQGPMFLSVQMHQPDRTAHAYMDALQAFWPGLQVLKGDLKKAIETHQMLYEVSKKHTFLPEAFTTDFEVHWGQHPLRPELVESTYFLYEATGDPYYLEVGKNIVEKINEHARVPCGFAALRDVRTLSHEDRMDSFVLAETFKYLYLLFTEKEDLVFNLNQFVFTTEAHILPLSLSIMAVNESASQELKYNVTLSSENEHEYTCPITQHDQGSTAKFAEEVRRNSRAQREGSCPNKKQAFAFSNNKPPRLRAEQFVPGNQHHVMILKSMGITVVHTKDGRIQLMQTASSAQSQDYAEEGIKFMQEMIELAKRRNDESAPQESPRVVQLMSAPYNGDVVLVACPARFGLDLSKGDVGMSAEVSMGKPFKACSPLSNGEELKHRIAVLERGDCMFIDKTRHAQAAGAVGVVIIDNNEGSSSDTQPIFAMSNDEDNKDDVKIPAVLLFSEEGRILKNAMAALDDTDNRLTVRLATKASGKSDKQEGSASKHDPESSQDSINSSSSQPSGEGKGKPSVDENKDILSHDGADQSQNSHDEQKQTKSPDNGDENIASITSNGKVDHSADLPHDKRVISVGEDEYVLCGNTGTPGSVSEKPVNDQQQHASQHTDDLSKQADTSSSVTDAPKVNKPHEDSSRDQDSSRDEILLRDHVLPRDEANGESTRTDNINSDQLANDLSLVNEQDAQSSDQASVESLGETQNEDAKDRT
ncbi:ER degradation-enhancing alpha-mannosidase-like protein 3 [Porites lutea]|uniref:ER degradation-enhancing alpha-mannosidase-like protein 3 n=1 Tax=Porites lutea TaxID=51062 RepID=UPI003CC6569F